jgi:hypothetical protein
MTTEKKWSDDPDRNPNTGIKYNRETYWEYLWSHNRYFFIFTMIFAIGGPIQSYFYDGVVGLGWLCLLAPTVCLLYNLDLWSEAKRGETS